MSIERLRPFIIAIDPDRNYKHKHMYCIYIYRITGPSWFNSRVMRESLAGTMPRKLQVHADIIDKTLPDTVSGRAHCGEEKKKKKKKIVRYRWRKLTSRVPSMFALSTLVTGNSSGLGGGPSSSSTNAYRLASALRMRRMKTRTDTLCQVS